MPRGRLTDPRKASDREAIRNFTESHIIQARIGKRGEVLEVKHVQFGWMPPETYYQLQKLHDVVGEILPGLGPLIQGAYQLKWALANVSFSGIPLIGLSLYGWAMARAVALLVLAGDKQDIDARAARDEASFLLTGVLGPFGEVLLINAIVRNSTFRPVGWYHFLHDLLPSVFAYRTDVPGDIPDFGGGLPGRPPR